jgi:hypothetical protein
MSTRDLSPAPFSEMALPDLQAWRDALDELASNPRSFGDAQERAIELRTECDGWIARLKPEAQAVLGPSFPLVDRVPALEADPVIGGGSK